MLKQGIENKASKVSDSVTGPDGREFHRRDFEDPDRPGFTVAGRLYTSTELHVLGVMGLTAPSGFSFAAHLPPPVAPDSTRVTAADAPAPLREAVAVAEKRLKEVEAKVTAALAARSDAEGELTAAGRAEDARRHNRAVVAAQQAEERRKDAELALAPLRVEVGRANEKLRAWMWDEGLRRQAA